MDFRILNERAATGYKDQSHDKAKDRKKVPVHAQGYIFIVFELITIPGGQFYQRSVSAKPDNYSKTKGDFLNPQINLTSLIFLCFLG
jgi:hypothetical protein